MVGSAVSDRGTGRPEARPRPLRGRAPRRLLPHRRSRAARRARAAAADPGHLDGLRRVDRRRAVLPARQEPARDEARRRGHGRRLRRGRAPGRARVPRGGGLERPWLGLGQPAEERSDGAADLLAHRPGRQALRAPLLCQGVGDRSRRGGRIAMRDLLIAPRNAPVPILLLEATTLNTGHNWRCEAMYMGEARRQGTSDQSAREDVDKNVILRRIKWDDLPACRAFPLGGAVASSAGFPGGFPPMIVPGLFDDLTVELVDGGVHDNQGVEGLADRGCTHWIISDGSGQMSDVARPSTRLPAVLGRVVSIYGDAEREQRLLQLLRQGGSVGFMHLQTGLPARERTPGGKISEQEGTIESTDFGVVEDVQRALPQVRTDLDAFCEIEAWSLMADAYQLTDKIAPGHGPRLARGPPDRHRIGRSASSPSSSRRRARAT